VHIKQPSNVLLCTRTLQKMLTSYTQVRETKMSRNPDKKGKMPAEWTNSTPGYSSGMLFGRSV
jgi:hypothetical protein